MSDRKIYEVLNNVKIDLEELDEVDELEKERYKKNFKNNKKRKNRQPGLKKTLAVASLALVIGLASQTPIGTRVYAATQSKLNSISYSLSQALNLDGDRNIESYSNIVNKTVESNNIGIKITDIIIDKDELILSTLVDLSGLEEKDRVSNVDFIDNISINGRRIKESGGTGSVGPVEGMEDIYSDIRHISIKNIDLEEELNIDIKLRDFSFTDENYEKHKLKGKWDFSFLASGRELARSTKELDIKHSFNIDGIQYRLDKFRYNPVNKKIYGEIDRSNALSNKSYDIELRGEDNLGNSVVFYASSLDESNIIFKYEGLNRDLDLDIDSIELRPYAVAFPEKSGEMSNDFKPIGEKFIVNLR